MAQQCGQIGGLTVPCGPDNRIRLAAVNHDLHPQSVGQRRRAAAGGAQPDNPQHRMLQFPQPALIFEGLIGALPDRVVRRYLPFCQGEHQPDGMFGDRARIHAWRIDHRDAFLCCRLQINAVGPYAVDGNHSKMRQLRHHGA